MKNHVVCAYVLGLIGAVACAAAPDETSNSEPVDEVTQAMSRCGYPPKRPWPQGCVFRCECANPVNGPFGEDPGDYVCYGDECHLEPRADCAFELICD